MERWQKLVVGDGAYEVSDLGRIRGVSRLDTRGRRRAGKLLTNARMNGRYMRVRLRARGCTEDLFVHRLVLEAFVGPRPSGMQACHNDGDRRNNSLANLRWDTARNNSRDKIRHGTIARGERNGFARLTESRVHCMRSLVALGVGPKVLSEAFGICTNHVRSVVRRQLWAWLSPRESTEREVTLADELRAAAKERQVALHAAAVVKAGSSREPRAAARAATAVGRYKSALASLRDYADNGYQQRTRAKETA